MADRRSLKVLSILILIILGLITPALAIMEESPPMRDPRVLINTRVRILDRDGREHIVTDCYDSSHRHHLILCSGPQGQSPIFFIPKEDISSIEMDGLTTNISGWDYSKALVVLKDGKTQSGFVQVEHIGHDGYRTFEGESPVGYFIISWLRVKKIQFEGQWKMEIPAEAP